MTNPLDLEHAIHRAYTAIVKFFSTAEHPLQFGDASTLLLGLISINPPPNAMSIAEFLEKWSALTINRECAIAREAFAAAVHQLYSLEACSDGGDDDSL
jgi:hypothetical protein